MAQAVGAHSSYDEPINTGGNREDLSSVLFNLAPTETPLITIAKKSKATATNHEWLTDTIEAAANNAHIEGDDATPSAPASRTRLGNYTQIMKKHAVVTGTQETVLKGGGIKSEMAYQVGDRMRALKTDLERAIVGVSNAKVAGDDTTAREMGSLDTYLTTNTNFASGSSAPAGNGGTPSDYAGTDRALTEAIFKAALADLWDNSGGNKNVVALVSSTDKGIISDFTASSTRNVTTDDKKLVASIDVYDGDFHTVKIMADRFIRSGSAFIIDPAYIAISDLRKIQTKDLAVLGDSARKEIVWETTLEVCSEVAHAHIADLT